MNYLIWRSKPAEIEVQSVAFLNGPLIGTWWMNIEYGRKSLEYLKPTNTEPTFICHNPMESFYYELYEIESDGTHVYVLSDKNYSVLGDIVMESE